jgi:hypothetical protein
MVFTSVPSRRAAGAACMKFTELPCVPADAVAVQLQIVATATAARGAGAGGGCGGGARRRGNLHLSVHADAAAGRKQHARAPSCDVGPAAQGAAAASGGGRHRRQVRVYSWRDYDGNEKAHTLGHDRRNDAMACVVAESPRTQGRAPRSWRAFKPAPPYHRNVPRTRCPPRNMS